MVRFRVEGKKAHQVTTTKPQETKAECNNIKIKKKKKGREDKVIFCLLLNLNKKNQNVIML